MIPKFPYKYCLLFACWLFLSDQNNVQAGLATNASLKPGSSGKPLITFSVLPGTKADEVIHLFVAAALRQSGQIVTYENVAPHSSYEMHSISKRNLPVSVWLKLMSTQIPDITWKNNAGVINVQFVQQPLKHNPLADRFSTSYTATLSLREWFVWMCNQFPRDEFDAQDDVYTRLGEPVFLDSSGGRSEVRLTIVKGENIRSFLTDLARSYYGTWAATLQDLSTPRTANHYNADGEMVYGLIKTTNIYFIK